MDGVSESAASAARDIRVVFSRLRRQLRSLAINDGLTPSQTSVLTRLWKDGSSSTSVLAAAERVRPQSMATIVAALEDKHLISRSPDPNDGRRQVVSLTEVGRQRAQNNRHVREEWLVRAMQDRFTEQERSIVNDALTLLQRLTDHEEE